MSRAGPAMQNRVVEDGEIDEEALDELEENNEASASSSAPAAS